MRMVGHCRHNLVDLNSGRIQASISYHFSTALGDINQSTLVQTPTSFNAFILPLKEAICSNLYTIQNQINQSKIHDLIKPQKPPSTHKHAVIITPENHFESEGLNVFSSRYTTTEVPQRLQREKWSETN